MHPRAHARRIAKGGLIKLIFQFTTYNPNTIYQLMTALGFAASNCPTQGGQSTSSGQLGGNSSEQTQSGKKHPNSKPRHNEDGFVFYGHHCNH